MKLWSKGSGAKLDRQIEEYTVGDDPKIDLVLLPYDCKASIAHAHMLNKIGVLEKKEAKKLESALEEIMELASYGKFEIKKEDEDCHTAIENYLTKKLGEIGKKIHTGRSRNDQVLVALALYQIDQLKKIRQLAKEFILECKNAKKKYGSIKMAGYTHMQKAMPASVGMWIGAYESAMSDNILLIDAQLKLLDQNPLGTGAGYGIPVFKLDRKMTAKELGFSKVLQNPIYAQHSRGKFSSNTLSVLVQIMYDLNKFATDLCIFCMKEFGFAKLPKELTTGSSIMPQKKNPDACELMRAKYHVVLGNEVKVKSMMANLMFGFNRDLQLAKAPLIESIEIAKSSLSIATLILQKIEFDKEKCEASLTDELYATEEAYKLVKQGMPFRDAYKKIGEKYNNESDKN